MCTWDFLWKSGHCGLFFLSRFFVLGGGRRGTACMGAHGRPLWGGLQELAGVIRGPSWGFSGTSPGCGPDWLGGPAGLAGLAGPGWLAGPAGCDRSVGWLGWLAAGAGPAG